MKDFDSSKAAFYLVAIIICTQMFIATTIVYGCLIGRFENVFAPGSCKGIMDDMQEIFQMCFTAAIAFAGGRMSVSAQPEIKLPEEKMK